ncbi:hypothetical protein [Paenibacillus shenyangensis]|uniref:hypothetical protein n=1 Tax=Paenibacillus sp. A9 TaxID=1284352 RepID=UPI001EE7222E|nr:hypothetical protein [Paenibacillus sp. A9]
MRTNRTERSKGNKGKGRHWSQGIYRHSYFVDSPAPPEDVPLFLYGVDDAYPSNDDKTMYTYNFSRLVA